MAAIKLPPNPSTALAALFEFLRAMFNALFGFNTFDVLAATTAALGACTYANGTLGVGATLTSSVNVAFPAVDGVTSVVGNTYLVKDQANKLQNGLYKLTTLGSGGAAWVLTRLTQFDQTAELINGARIGVRSGTANGGKTWRYSGASSPVMGTGLLTFALDAYTQVIDQGPVNGTTSEAITGAGAVDPNKDVTMFTSSGVGQALTIADGRRVGQLKTIHHTVRGSGTGTGVLTPASAGNFATFTLTALHDSCYLRWNGLAWDIVGNTGGTIA